jgi:hypothetical protein
MSVAALDGPGLLAAVNSCDTFGERYEVFELILRHEHYGEPKPVEDCFGIGTKFYPKLRVLREACERQSASSGQSFFEVHLPHVIHQAAEPVDAALLDTPLTPGEIRRVPRCQIRALLANALLLRAPRGSALDWLGGGVDPLYVSGAKLAVEKVSALLSFLVEEDADADGEVELLLAEDRGADVELADAAAEAAGSDEATGAGSDPLITLAFGEPSESTPPPAALLCASSARIGGGALQGRTATEEESMLLRFPESLVALAVTPRPLGPTEALMIRHLCARCEWSGAAHQLRFEGMRPREARRPTDLICVDASRAPGAAQFEEAYLRRELTKCAAGLAAYASTEADTSQALASEDADARGTEEAEPQRGLGPCSGYCPGTVRVLSGTEEAEPRRGLGPCSAGLWGSGGLSGAQPVLRLLILCAAAAATRTRLHVIRRALLSRALLPTHR